MLSRLNKAQGAIPLISVFSFSALFLCFSCFHFIKAGEGGSRVPTWNIMLNTVPVPTTMNPKYCDTTTQPPCCFRSQESDRGPNSNSYSSLSLPSSKGTFSQPSKRMNAAILTRPSFHPPMYHFWQNGPPSTHTFNGEWTLLFHENYGTLSSPDILSEELKM